MPKIDAATRLRSNTDEPIAGRDRVRSLEVALTRFMGSHPAKRKEVEALLDALKPDVTPKELDALENDFKALKLGAATLTADEAGDDDSRHWLLRVKSILRLAKGQGAIRIADANEKNNTVVLQMKPQVYLDSEILVKLLLVFKKEDLAMVITTHSSGLINLMVGPEGFLEAAVGGAV